MKLKPSDYVVLAILAALLYFGPPAGRGSVVPPSTPVDCVIAVYESKNQPVAEASVMAGVTVQALDKVGKWRQYDKDQIPAAIKPVLDPIVAKNGIPCLGLIRGGSVVASAKFPATDAELSAYLQKNGGF